MVSPSEASSPGSPVIQGGNGMALAEEQEKVTFVTMLFGIAKEISTDNAIKKAAKQVLGQDLTVSAAAAAGLVLTGFTATGLFVGY